MSLNWNEIKKRAVEFSSEWKEETRERAESQTFWNQFFSVFGLERRRVASFDANIKQLGEKWNFIDLFWKGTLIVEHKSRGKNLDSAYNQALAPFPGIDENDLPRFIVVSDFYNFKLYDLEENINHDFNIEELYKNVHLFAFMLGRHRKVYSEEPAVNIKAAELMGELHDSLKDDGYTGHPLEILLVRVVYCLFSDDTGVFNKDHFKFYIEEKTNIDGSDLGLHLSSIFQVLNTSPSKRQGSLDEDLAAFPYINGDLFAEQLPITSFNSNTRQMLLECCKYDWSKVSPAIFGSLFQSVMDKETRRDLGAHYTSEKNILKCLNDLFLDDLKNEFNKNRKKPIVLKKLLQKISKITLFDPACGGGNFLIVAYRELRLLEVEILEELAKPIRGQRVLNIKDFIEGIDVDALYGIEIEEFSSRIAEIGIWLIDHLMNIRLSQSIGEYYQRLPLKKSPYIINGNAFVGRTTRDFYYNACTAVSDNWKKYSKLTYVGVTTAGKFYELKSKEDNLSPGGELLSDRLEEEMDAAEKYLYYKIGKGGKVIYITSIGVCNFLKKGYSFSQEGKYGSQRYVITLVPPKDAYIKEWMIKPDMMKCWEHLKDKRWFVTEKSVKEISKVIDLVLSL